MLTPEPEFGEAVIPYIVDCKWDITRYVWLYIGTNPEGWTHFLARGRRPGDLDTVRQWLHVMYRCEAIVPDPNWLTDVLRWSHK